MRGSLEHLASIRFWKKALEINEKGLLVFEKSSEIATDYHQVPRTGVEPVIPP